MNIPTPTLDNLVINPHERKTLTYARGRAAIHSDANAFISELRRRNSAAAKTIGKSSVQAWVPQMKRALIEILGGEHLGEFVVFKDPDGTIRHAKY